MNIREWEMCCDQCKAKKKITYDQDSETTSWHWTLARRAARSAGWYCKNILLCDKCVRLVSKFHEKKK